MHRFFVDGAGVSGRYCPLGRNRVRASRPSGVLRLNPGGKGVVLMDGHAPLFEEKSPT